MVKHISIKNFKSIKNLDFEARRVNVFIGEPNAGKSNILEALGVFTPGVDWRDIVRVESDENVFFENNTTTISTIIAHKEEDSFPYVAKFWLNGDRVEAEIGETYPEYDPQDSTVEIKVESKVEGLFRYYKFAVPESFKISSNKFLNSPNGSNLLFLLNNNKDFRELVVDLLSNIGFKFNLRIGERKLEIAREIDGVLISHPYKTISDTFQRIIFYLAAIESNKNAVLLFEEPEANTFPFYTKELAEKIALDVDNQYFLVTHNPYLLNTLIEKTPIEDLNIFVTYMKDYETHVHPMSKEDIAEVFDFDEAVFFNLDRYLDESIHS
ncbi:ATP/GTP-binding protein [Siphonobacter sp. SORGH_AS_1065]|uniref:AAA family ATPase n=1 Tax=Siphonobacter sp. SORGH_AS_1065 TaxID=3041795 RepID=UPI00277EA0A4|nr:AAA family ATPase [Siphonobacter sp. SORGH_AS_1065]MDQ1086081.1 AAA15 family ATPase/GTPase [Siphonobacter sp. SORGH_AS_1065]